MSKRLNIYDANSWVRRNIEVDPTGLPLRNLIMDVNSSTDIEVFVWDGARGNERRRALYPAYKSNRSPMDPAIWEVLNFTKELLAHTPAIQIVVPGYEGDDVIAALVGSYASQLPITIFSTDRDLYALCAVEGVRHHVIDQGGKAPSDPHLVRLIKTMVGDPSDTIPGVKGFGQGAWDKCDKDALLSWFTHDCKPELHEGQLEQIMELFGMGKASTDWLIKNQKLVHTFWTIIGFFPPPPALIEVNTTVGVRNLMATNALLRDFHQ